MSATPSEPDTSWSLLRAAHDGDVAARDAFARQYLPVARAYLSARWRGPRKQLIGDALQEIALECYREGGAIQRANAGEVDKFKAFFLGLVRKVALRVEERVASRQTKEDAIATQFGEERADETSLSRIFDRAWAAAVIREAADLLKERARSDDPAAQRRVELLRLRFEEGLAIRDIAKLWGEDAARVHHEYARARENFVSALREVVARRHPGSPEAVARVLRDLVALVG